MTGNRAPEWVNIGLCGWIWLVGPVVLIVTASGARCELDWEKPQGFVGFLLRLFVGSQLAFWGLTFILFGVGVASLFFWSVIVEKQYSWLSSARGLPIFFTMIGLGVFLLFIAFGKRKAGRVEHEEYGEQFAGALGTPDWMFYKEHLGRPVPTAVIELFDGDSTSWQVSCLDDDDLSFLINSLSPIDERFLLTRESTGFIFDVLPFALTDDGDPVFLKPGPEESDVVYIAVGSEYEKLSDSIANWKELAS